MMESYIRELLERAIEVTRSYAIWWELVDVKNRSAREEVIRDHEDFFGATAQAHFLTVVVVLYQLFDKRPGTKSIPHALGELASIHSAKVAAIRADLDPHQGILKKIFDIRGNVYAHRNASLAPELVFERAKLSVSALGGVVGAVEEAISSLAEIAGIESKDELLLEFDRRADFARDDIKYVFDALRRTAT